MANTKPGFPRSLKNPGIKSLNLKQYSMSGDTNFIISKALFIDLPTRQINNVFLHLL